VSQKSREELKPRFESGDVPTQQDFWNLLDSYWNVLDDGPLSIGTSGTSGTSGIDGAPGSSGTSGARGPSGSAGSSGFGGSSGSSGFGGSSGSSGANGPAGSAGSSGVDYIFPSDLVVSLSGNKTFGRYVNGSTIPATGKTVPEVIEMSLVEPISPTVSLTTSSTIPFNTVSVTIVLNFSYVINSLGASVSTATLEWGRDNTPPLWLLLPISTATPGTYTFTYTDTAFNTQPFKFRYIVTDTESASETIILTVTPEAYVAPSISLSVAASSISSPETSTKRERGNTSSVLSGTVTRNTSAVPLSTYTLQYSIDGGSIWNDITGATNISISASGGSISSFTHNDLSLVTSSSILYRVQTVDSYQATDGNSTTINFVVITYFGASSTAPVTSSDVRSLPQRIFSDSMLPTFDLITGTSFGDFTIAIPATKNLVQVQDVESSFANITSTYVLSVSLTSISDYYGNSVSYKVYTASYALPYSPSHTHRITTS